MKKILITGGAGFVGSHTTDALLAQGYSVRVFDNLTGQVHPTGLPPYLSSDVEFIHGDVRDRDALCKAVVGMDAIYHFAAAVGVGQSMYEFGAYSETNIQGTANLLQAILDTGTQPEKLIVASSMSIYGEGRYLCRSCGVAAPQPRGQEQLKQRIWEMRCPACLQVMLPIATDEDKPLQYTSLYALSKKTQEEMTLLFGRTYSIPTVALRYFNIYGPRQALSNPYTGVAAIFASCLMNHNSPTIFEDGMQTRDFVNVRDIVQANLLALHCSGADGTAVNIGTGTPIRILQVAQEMSFKLGSSIQPQLSGLYRSGDIRHCYADISKAVDTLGFRPQVNLAQGLSELVPWIASQNAFDRTDEAMQELTVRGLAA